MIALPRMSSRELDMTSSNPQNARLCQAVHMDSIGKYQIVKEIGRGATSTVYLARDPFNDQHVALKLFDPKVLKNRESGNAFRKLLQTEASLAGKLSHPHIVRVFDAVLDADENYMVMEYVEGDTLEQYGEIEQLLSLNRIAEIGYKCCKALEYAQHQGVIHRDIKPANILLCGDSDIKISDFGAALLENQQATQVTGVGSPAYMSPEQIEDGVLSHQTDIYSLGVTLYRLLTGRQPFEAANNYSMIYQVLNVAPPLPSTFRTDLPPVFDSIVQRAMCKDTALRYQTWDEFASDLSTFLNDSTQQEEEIFDTKKFNTVRALAFFQDFNDVELWEVLRISEWHRINADESIIDEGEEGFSFFILAQGSVRIVKQGRTLDVLHPGNCFGEMTHHSEQGTRRSTDVIAKTEVIVIEIDPTVLALSSNNCRLRFSEAFIRILVKRLSASNTRVVRLLTDDGTDE